MRHYRATRALNFESLAISHAEKCYVVLCALAAILQRLINRRTLPLLAFAHLHSCTFSPYAQTRFSRGFFKEIMAQTWLFLLGATSVLASFGFDPTPPNNYTTSTKGCPCFFDQKKTTECPCCVDENACPCSVSFYSEKWLLHDFIFMIFFYFLIFLYKF